MFAVFQEQDLVQNPETHVKPLHGMIWHEGIMGRIDEDVCSTAVKLLTQTPYREGKVVNVW